MLVVVRPSFGRGRVARRRGAPTKDANICVAQAGITVLLVEQQLRFARRVASDFCILEKGRCVAGGSIDELTDTVVREHLSV